MSLEFLISVVVFLFGLIVGSFLNVCIYRLPRGISVVTPRSRCPHCERPIRPHENLPLLSYLLQGGRCRGCGNAISWVYPVVEGATAILFVGLYWKYGLSTPLFVNGILVSILLVLIFIDLFDRILPNLLTLGGAVSGFLMSPLQSPEFWSAPGSLHTGNALLDPYLNSLAGMAFGGGFLWLVAALYLKLRKIEGMGFGDVKMMGMVGAFLGWQFAWLTILAGSFLGAVTGGLYILLSGSGSRYELPFGTFLGVAAFAVLGWGATVLKWYLGIVISP